MKADVGEQEVEFTPARHVELGNILADHFPEHIGHEVTTLVIMGSAYDFLCDCGKKHQISAYNVTLHDFSPGETVRIQS